MAIAGRSEWNQPVTTIKDNNGDFQQWKTGAL
jgi:hypothetical protein